MAGADEIIDDSLGKRQSDINEEVKEFLGSGGTVDERIATERERAMEAEEQLRQAYSSLSQSQPVPVTELPATGEAGKIYRLAGESSYADYMYSENDLTTPIKMAEYDNAIDDEPTAGSDNLVKSGGVFNKLRYSKIIEISEVSALAGWQQLKRPIKGLISIRGNHNIRIAKSTSKGENTITAYLSDTVDRVYLYLDDDYTCYFNDTQSDNFNVVIEYVDIADIFGGIISESYLTGWVKGYYKQNRFNPSDSTAFVSCVIDVEPGKTYFLPYSNTNSVQSVVNLDSNGDFVSVNKQGDSSKVYNTFAIVKAVTPKIGITYYLQCGNLGSRVIFNDLCRFPYICLSDSKYCNPYKECLDLKESNPIQNLFEMFDFRINEITEYENGYYSNRDRLETENYSSWRYAVIDVEPDEWYLVNCSLHSNVRIFDVYEDDSMRINTSVSDKCYDALSSEKLTWALVKTNGVGLGLNFIDPSYRIGQIGYGLPKYVKLGKGEYQDIIFLIIQAMFSTSYGFDGLNMKKIVEYSSGYFNKDGHLETQVVGNWKYALIDTVPGNYYILNTCMIKNIRIFDMDEQGTMSINQSVSDAEYTNVNSDKFVIVKAASVKIGVSFLETQNKIPSYCDISAPNNAISVILNKINNVGAGKTLIVSKSGGGDYNSFVRAIMDNYGKWDVTLHLNEGVYDLFEEFEEYYGTSDFRELTKYGRGLELGYNITVEGSPNAIIKADYTGNDAGIQRSFSPINCTMDVNGGGYTLRGVNIRCSRVRYAVHDEKTGTGLGSYSNVYDNCNFYIDNTDNDTWHSSQCIGGGLGTSGNIVVRNCIFESVDPAFTGAAVSWHNNRNEGAKSQISCVGNVVKGNRGFRFSWYGDSQEITEVICTGNSVGAATITGAETQDTSPYENIVLYDWNNVIRN